MHRRAALRLVLVLAGILVVLALVGARTHATRADDATDELQSAVPAAIASDELLIAAPAASGELPSAVSADTSDLTSAGPARRVVGYYNMWSYDNTYGPADIDFSVVTHVVHFCVTPTANGGVAVPVKTWLFPDPSLVSQVHIAGAKVLLGVCEESPSPRFAAASSTTTSRARLVDNLASLVQQHGYDGLDLDWEYPRNAADRANYAALVAALRVHLAATKTISIAAPAGPGWGQWYDIGAMLPHLDWVGSMTYALNDPSWSAHAGFSSPLYALPDSGDASVDSARRYWLGRGVPSAKLLIGVPFFGEQFDGVTAWGQQPATTSGGVVDYSLSADGTKNAVAPLLGDPAWTRYWDSFSQVPFLQRLSPASLISYDDPASIAAKCQYVLTHALGGVIIYHLGEDRVPAPTGRGTIQPLLQATGACR